jgi:signal transduction histidine kinase
VTRSQFAIKRLLVVPYGALLILYIAVVGGGGAWLYLQVRAVETRLLVEEILAVVEPLIEQLDALEPVVPTAREAPDLIAALRGLFGDLPALTRVAVQDRAGGFVLTGARGPGAEPRATAPRPARALPAQPPAQRLLAEGGREFRLAYELGGAERPPARLALTFDRSMLLARVHEALASVRHAILSFVLVGTLGILVALGITAVAMDRTRQIEAHFQEIYRRASLTELAAELVHDLKNPLMALRANVKALLIAPEQSAEIARELERDIVALGDKLNGFLRLTRHDDDRFEPVELGELVGEAVRIARPALEQHGLEVAQELPPDLPRPMLQRQAMRDALVNLLFNAAQSGQTEGAVRIRAGADGAILTLAVEDHGQGIPAEHLPRLFDAFYTTRADGNGLGLAIVQRVARDHRGRVRAENRPEGGARLVIEVPLRQEEIPRWWKGLRKRSST